MPPYPPQGPAPGPGGIQPPYPPQPGGQFPVQPNQPGMPPYPGQPPYPGPPAMPGQPAGPYQPQPSVTPYTPPASLNQRGPDPVPPPPPRPESPYDFFMAERQPVRKAPSLALPAGGIKGLKFSWIIGGAVGLLLIIVLATLLAPRSPDKLALLSVAQAQTEAMRICDDGVKNSKTRQNKSFAINCSLSMMTDQRELVAYLNKAGTSANGKNLGLGRNAKADSQLAAAKGASNYDDAFQTVAKAQFATLNRALKQAAAAPDTTATERKQLNKYNEAAQLLIKQLEQR